MTRDPSISFQLCRGLLRASKALGVSELALLTQAGVEGEDFVNPEGRAPLPVYYDLLEALADLSGDPYIGLRIPELSMNQEYGLLAFLFFSSETVGSAYGRIIRYQQLLVSELQLSMQVADGRVYFSYEMWGPPRPAHKIIGDSFISETLMGLMMLCGPEVRGQPEIQIVSEETPDAPYERELGLRPAFCSPGYAVSFDAAILDKAVDTSHPQLAQVLEHQAQIMMKLLAKEREAPGKSSQAGSSEEQARTIVAEMLPDGVPKIEEVAKRLGQSSRSLQRHLSSEGTSLSELVEQLRKSTSQLHLAQGASVTEVAFLLGYCEVSSFHRAFKRWTGVAPGAWRQSQEASQCRRGFEH